SHACLSSIPGPGASTLYGSANLLGLFAVLAVVKHFKLGGLDVLELAVSKSPPHGGQRCHEEDGADGKGNINARCQPDLIQDAIRTHAQSPPPVAGSNRCLVSTGNLVCCTLSS